MPKTAGQKTRLLRVLAILRQYTDENHILCADEILAHLTAYGIEAERKSIYDDISALAECGFDIQNIRGKGGGYRLLSDEWQISELKTLIDAVQSSRFLSEKKSAALIGKLKKLTSRYNAESLARHVHITGRAKSDNESIFYSIDVIHEAIRRGNKIAFYYLDYLPNGKKVRRHDGRRYEVSPVELVIDDEKYYLIAAAEGGDTLRNYRVDKMEGTTLLPDTLRTLPEGSEQLDPARYSLAAFGMFAGTPETVRLRAKNRMASILIDRFDRENCTMIPDGNDHFTVAVRVVISPQFFGWLFGLEGNVTILSPASARQAYENMLKSALEGTKD